MCILKVFSTHYKLISLLFVFYFLYPTYNIHGQIVNCDFARFLTTDDMTGLRFAYKNIEYEVIFTTKNEAGGRISISHDGRQILEEKFTIQVGKQKGIF